MQKILSIFITGVMLFLFGCSSLNPQENISEETYINYKDIPGITNDEINAIKALKEENKSFVYGMNYTTETFIKETGDIGGYSALICSWLTKLFDIPFTPRIYEWGDLIEGLKKGEIHFTGELTNTEERKGIYYMTDAIAERSVKYMRIKDSVPFQKISKTRKLRYAFFEGTTTVDDVTALSYDKFEPIYVDDYETAYSMLKNGKVDAFFDEGIAEAAFDIYGDVIAKDFYPMIHSPVSMSTQTKELVPVISVVQKALKSGGKQYLDEIYNLGYQEYLKNKLSLQLTKEELEYIHLNPTVSLAAEFDNYPVSYYNTYEKQWDGIAFDILRGIEQFTGMKFKIVNSSDTDFHVLSEMLEKGEASIITELLHSEKRQNSFLWPETKFFTDKYALLSKWELDNIKSNDILNKKVGTKKDTTHETWFQKSFPNHAYTTEFNNTDEMFEALESGKVDLVMSRMSQLLTITNYYERPGYKVNFGFDVTYDSTFGFNKDEAILCSIVDKALQLIDIELISKQWMNKTFDYNTKVIQARQPWLIGTSVLLIFILSLLVVLYLLKRRDRKNLAKLVQKRTFELETEKATLQAMFNSIPDFVFCKDLNLKYTRCNKSMEEHFGVHAEDIIGKDDAEGLGAPAEIVKACNESDQKLLKTGEPTLSEELVAGRDGRLITCETIKTPIIRNGKIVGLMGVSRNITERKKVEKMKNALNEMSVLFLSQDDKSYEEKMTVGIGLLADLVNLDRVSVWRNFMAPDGMHTSQIYRWDREAGGTTPPTKGLKNISLAQFYTNWRKLMTGEEVINGPVRLMKGPPVALKNFAVVSALITPLVINNEESWGFVLFEDRKNEVSYDDDAVEAMRTAAFLCANTIQRAEMESKLNEALNNATVASQAKGEFLSRMSHEIRTPLNAIIGMINIGMSTEDKAKKDYCFDRADSASKHLLGIINDILDMSKIEADKFELSYNSFSFEKMLMSITNVVNVRVEEKHQNLVINQGSDIPRYMTGDELRLSQVITNLLTNAVKFTPEEGTVTLNAEKADEQDDEITLKIEITDTGIGISKEQQERLFSAFEQADANITQKFGGTGLGLAISKRIIELMGGTVWIESELGEGSKFIFTVKMKNAERRKEKRLVIDTKNKGNIRILAVDDSEEVRDYFIHFMEINNLRCDVAGDGNMAVEMMKEAGEEPYNLFFVDWHMPGINGIELTKKIKEIDNENSVILMSSVTDWNTIEKEAITAGVKSFISKPLFPSELINLINDCFGTGIKDEVMIKQLKPRYDFSGYTILIAEDVEINREIMTAILEETGISIDYAINGEAAVSQFSENPEKYNLILMDVNMPEMDGYEATKAIREDVSARAKDIPIIAMTANVFREDIEKCIETGMNAHIGKPIDSGNLFEVLDKYLSQSEDKVEMKNVYKLKHGIAWNDDFLLGDALVDTQHQRLFELVSNLVEACIDGSDTDKLKETLDFLVKYTVQHFTDEEALQLEYGYPGYECHKKLHEDFKEKVSGLVQRFNESGSSDELSKDVNKILVRWLVNHVQNEDKKIGEYIGKTINTD